MSGARDRDGTDDGSDWQEPAHLSGDQPTGDEPNFADRRKTPRDDTPAGGDAWQPPGWDLPPATPDRDRRPDGERAVDPSVDPSWAPPATQAPAERGPGLFGRRRARDPEMERAFTPETDPLGAQGWALQHGWT